MTSQLVIRLEGYPDEVVIPGTVVAGDVEFPRLEALIRTTGISAAIASAHIEAVVEQAVTADLEVVTVDADGSSDSIDAEFGME